MHHPRFLTFFNNVHPGRGRRRLFAFSFSCAASPKEEVAKATAGEREKQKTDDQANDPSAVRATKSGDVSMM